MSLSEIGSRATRMIWFASGAALFGWLVASIGPRSILEDLARVGPGVVVILALEFVVDVFNTLGWWYTVSDRERAGTWGRLFWVRSAGNAINDSTPAASLGGEPAKIVLLRGRISIPAVTASLLATKVSCCFAKTIFIVAGMALVWSRLKLSRHVSIALMAGFILMVIGVSIFTVIQIRGIGQGMIRTMRRLRIPQRWIELIESSSHGVDAHLSDFYTARKADLMRSMLAHCGGFAVGILQMLLIIHWLGLGYDPLAAVGVEAFSTLIGFVMFAVPGSLGVQEGGKVLIFAALGMPRSAAMAAGITFRLVALVEIALGLVVFVILQHSTAVPRQQPQAVPASSKPIP